MRGSVYKRCPCAVARNTKGERLACRKDHGSWVYVADVGLGENGKRRQERRGGFPTRMEAEQALAERLRAVREGRDAHDDRKTVGSFLQEWLDAKEAAGLRRTTARAYRQHLRDYLVPHLGHVRLRDLRPGHVQAMLRAIPRGGGPGPATIRRVHATLRSALTSALRQQYVATNAAANVELPAAPRPRVRPWEPAELGAFLDHAVADRLGALFEVMAATGLRRGEACGLRWSDVDLERSRLVVRQQLVQLADREAPDEPCDKCNRAHRGLSFGPPKTHSGEARVVDLDTATVGVVMAHRLAQDAERAVWREAYADHGLVFCRNNGDPLPLEAVTRRFRELSDAAGVRRVRLHDLRHGAASLRLAAGVDLAVVSKQLGHSSIGITSDTYSHLLEGVGRDAAERAAALVPRTPRDHYVTTPPESTGDRDEEREVIAGQ